MFLFLTDPDLSFSLLLICSYFLAQSELQCFYKMCSYKKKECMQYIALIIFVHQNKEHITISQIGKNTIVL